MDLNLRGKSAIVSGASKGIGAAVSEEFAREGVNLVLCSRTPEPLAEVAARLRATYAVRVDAVPADLATQEGIKAVAAAALSHGSIDIVVNNAGSIPAGSIGTLAEESWRKAYELKLWGYIRMCRAMLPSMRANGGGVIVNVIGTSGKVPAGGYVAGSLANAGLMNFTSSLAQDVGPDGIRVVGVSPGQTRTDRLESIVATMSRESGRTPEQIHETFNPDKPLRRMAEPDDIASLVCFLASDRAAMITGCVIPVDGGSTRAV